MDSHLQQLASRVEDDPFFLACPLRLYARSEEFDDDKLSAILGCSQETLVSLRLCRTPREESALFQQDIERIVAKFQVNGAVLREAVRRGQTILRMRKTVVGGKGSLLAARDGPTNRPDPQASGGQG